MKKVKVQIVETFRRYVDVKAVNEDEAFDIINEKIENGEIDLLHDDDTYKYDRELFVESLQMLKCTNSVKEDRS